MSEDYSDGVKAVLELVENRCAFLRDMIKDAAERMQLAKTSPNWLRGQWKYQREKNTNELAQVVSGRAEIKAALEHRSRCPLAEDKQVGKALELLVDVTGDGLKKWIEDLQAERRADKEPEP